MSGFTLSDKNIHLCQTNASLAAVARILCWIAEEERRYDFD